MQGVNEIMLNPIRMRIIQEIAAENPRTTMYRHIKLLLDNNILTIVSEKKIRGSFERTLAMNIEEMAKHNIVENAS